MRSQDMRLRQSCRCFHPGALVLPGRLGAREGRTAASGLSRLAAHHLNARTQTHTSTAHASARAPVPVGGRVSVRRSSLPVLGADRPAAVPLEPPAVARLHAKFPALDGVRALAAISVVAFHVEQLGYGQFGPAERVVGHLNSGVVLFFLLSGFLLYRPFVVARAEGGHVATRAYLVRRLMRIVPAYWLALIALSIWPGLPGFYGGSWLRGVLFLKIYSGPFRGAGPAVPRGPWP